ncbi:farnesol dehydrogenase-like [Macrosteles quadrilineatus]|uniref:farnesol dehydrogenase-like n=1 Tax=Macrosteles quadrilineatus TaxID=74068 RepID=UPI0023E08FA4|nr:farnesol dehydrogenase-like [Macrosteles quadrilineatus]
MERFAGRVAVVTGARAGIGEAISRALVSYGILVVGLARNEDKLKELEKELSGAKGKFYGIKTDLRSEEEIVKAFKWTEKHVGGVDILINNAGVSTRTRVLDGNMEIWRNMFDVNVFAVGICTREAVRSMKTRGVTDGNIINVNSVTGHEVSTLMSQSVYSATKHVLTILTEAMRRELVEGNSTIRVSSVSPGRVMTEMIAPGGVIRATDRGPTLDCPSVADAVMYVLATPSHVQISEMIVRPVGDLTHRFPKQI